jgi:hypothetical protein
MQWTVERISDPMAMRGPRRVETAEVVEADGLSIEAGTLIFITAGDITRAYGQGAWARVAPVATEPGA